MSQLLSDFYLIIIHWPEFQNFKEIFLCIIFDNYQTFHFQQKKITSILKYYKIHTAIYLNSKFIYINSKFKVKPTWKKLHL